MTTLAVIVPHYRQATYLAECLDSLVAQTREPDEIIVVDSSPVETVRIMPRYHAPVRHIVRPPAGVAAARNAGLAATTCDLVAFLDSDNIALPDRLCRQEAAFAQDGNIVMCHGAMVLVDRKGSTYEGASRFSSEQVAAERQLGWLLERNRVAADTACVRRDVVMALGGFCETRGVREDYDLWLRMATAGPFRYLDEPLARYRRHDTNLSNDERYMFEWEAGALRRVDVSAIADALQTSFPESTQRALVFGEILLRRGDRDEAERHFAALADSSSGALFHLGHVAADRGDLARAESCLRRALEQDAADAGSWNNLGVVLARTGRSEAAADAFAHAVHLRPTYFDARENLRRAHDGGAEEWKLTRRRLRAELMPLAAIA